MTHRTLSVRKYQQRQCFVLLSFFVQIAVSLQEWRLFTLVVRGNSFKGFFKSFFRVVLLTRNWAMSKAKSWTKLNRCSASGATRPKLGCCSSGATGTSLLTEHKVTDTTSQQSWATRWQKRDTEKESQETKIRCEKVSIMACIFNRFQPNDDTYICYTQITTILNTVFQNLPFIKR